MVLVMVKRRVLAVGKAGFHEKIEKENNNEKKG